ncbi:hypothetical protein GCM10022408_20640 [Hymenobacter fastidiosus]|uniref:Uncharacterized protein n=1 Tax=Hymenobacter fastidiosus TaxID=486264 RepID=A0ABP7S8W8_9BACT
MPRLPTATGRYDDAFSPRRSLVDQPSKTTALLASYAGSFTPDPGVDGTNTNRPPSLTDHYEAGIRNDRCTGREGGGGPKVSVNPYPGAVSDKVNYRDTLCFSVKLFRKLVFLRVCHPERSEGPYPAW